MKLSTVFAAIASVCAAVTSATPARRAAYPTVPAAKIKQYALWGWGPLEKSAGNADMVILDGDLESAGTIKKLRSQGKFVACYMSAGTLENWRGDAKKFISATDGLAKKYKGFGGKETWFDVTSWQSLKGPMGDRISSYANKGCQAVEFDNIDCYLHMCVPGASRSTLVKKQVEYVNWLADKAHSLGMAVGMKNAQELIPKVASKMQFAINEECQAWNECKLYNQFTSKGKLVVGVEYNDNSAGESLRRRQEEQDAHQVPQEWQVVQLLLNTRMPGMARHLVRRARH